VPGPLEGGDPASFSMPHERVLARTHGLGEADGLLPFAAWQVRQAGGDPGDSGWAWITPCHWRVGTDHVRMAPLQELQLDAADSRALLDAMRPYFQEDGIELRYDAPLRWLASGELFRSLPSASLDRVAGRVLDRWMPAGDAGRPLRRLQQEMQMLLYTLPLNDERQRGGLLPINSFWASGTGVLPAGTATAAPEKLQITHRLRDPALQEDWQAWASAWHELDAGECARLVGERDRGAPVRLTLCGESASRTWTSEGAGWRLRAAALVAKPRIAAALEVL
jgi:hypothetical protein